MREFFRWSAGMIKAPFRFGCLVFVGAVALWTGVSWSWVADLLSRPSTNANLLGAALLVTWLAGVVTFLRILYKVYAPKSK